MLICSPAKPTGRRLSLALRAPFSVTVAAAGAFFWSSAKLPLIPAGHRSSVDLPALVITIGNCCGRNGRARTVLPLTEYNFFCLLRDLRDFLSSISRTQPFRRVPTFATTAGVRSRLVAGTVASKLTLASGVSTSLNLKQDPFNSSETIRASRVKIRPRSS